MSLDPQLIQRLDDLTAALLEGGLDEAGRAELNELLDSNPEAQAYYAKHLATHVALLKVQGASWVDPRQLQQHLTHVAPARAVRHPASTRRIAPVVYAAAAALLFAAAAVALYVIASLPADDEPDTSGPAIATLIESTQTVIYENDVANEGGEYASGNYSIESGSAQFLLTNRVNVSLSGRTRMQMRDPRNVALSVGHADFRVPHGVTGFTVHLPHETEIIDLGTAFHIDVDDDGVAKLVVTEGRVAIKRPGVETVELAAGYAADLTATSIDVDRMRRHIAYVVDAGTVGIGPFDGSVGMDFVTEKPVTITHLGAFDSHGNGFVQPITVTLFQRDDGGTPDEFSDDSGRAVATVSFDGNEGELIGGTRFKKLTEPLRLPAGFVGTIAAAGYGPNEKHGNIPERETPTQWRTDDGSGALRFVGTSRFGKSPLAFPREPDRSTVPNHYAAGSFIYEITPEPEVEPTPDAAGSPDAAPEPVTQALRNDPPTTSEGDTP